MTAIEHEIQQLKSDIINMSKLVSIQMKDAILALTNMDKQLSIEIIATEKEVNAFELRINKSCENIFALHNPVANDLRLVLAQLRINYNLEKIGDIAASIAKFVKKSNGFDFTILLEKTHALQMFEEANDLLSDVMVSFEKEDIEMARNVLKRDRTLNELNKTGRKIIIEHIKNDPQNVEEYLKVLSIIRKLERSGDQCKSIAEEIIFFVDAKIIKHSQKS